MWNVTNKNFIKITSNDGWQEVAFLLIEDDISHNNDLFVVRLFFTAQFWNRKDVSDLEKSFESIELQSDKKIEVSQLLCSKRLLLTLAKKLKRWGHNRKSFSMNLSAEIGQNFTFFLGLDNSLVSSLDKPVCRISVQDARHTIVWKMIVDYGSIVSLYEQIEAFCSKG